MRSNSNKPRGNPAYSSSNEVYKASELNDLRKKIIGGEENMILPYSYALQHGTEKNRLDTSGKESRSAERNMQNKQNFYSPGRISESIHEKYKAANADPSSLAGENCRITDLLKSCKKELNFTRNHLIDSQAKFEKMIREQKYHTSELEQESLKSKKDFAVVKSPGKRGSEASQDCDGEIPADFQKKFKGLEEQSKFYLQENIKIKQIYERELNALKSSIKEQENRLEIYKREFSSFHAKTKKDQDEMIFKDEFIKKLQDSVKEKSKAIYELRQTNDQHLKLLGEKDDKIVSFDRELKKEKEMNKIYAEKLSELSGERVWKVEQRKPDLKSLINQGIKRLEEKKAENRNSSPNKGFSNHAQQDVEKTPEDLMKKFRISPTKEESFIRLKSQVLELEEKIFELRNENNELKEQCRELNEKNSYVEEDANRVKAIYSRLIANKEKGNENGEGFREKEKYQTRIKELEGKLENAMKENEKIFRHYQDLVKEFEGNKKKWVESENLLRIVNGKNEILQREHEKVLKENKILQEMLKNGENYAKKLVEFKKICGRGMEKVKLAIEIDKKRVEFEDFEADFEEVANVIEKMRGFHEKYEEISEENKALFDIIKELNEKIENLEENSIKTSNSTEDLRKKHEKALKSQGKLETTEKDLSEMKSKLQESKQENQKLLQILNEKQKQLNDLSQSFNKITEDLQNADDKNEQLERAVKEYTEDQKNYEKNLRSLVKLQEENMKMQKLINDLDQAHKERHEKSLEIKELLKKIFDLQEEIKCCNETISEKQKITENLQEEIQQAYNLIENLQQKCKNIEESYENSKKANEDLMKMLDFKEKEHAAELNLKNSLLTQIESDKQTLQSHFSSVISVSDQRIDQLIEESNKKSEEILKINNEKGIIEEYSQSCEEKMRFFELELMKKQDEIKAFSEKVAELEDALKLDEKNERISDDKDKLRFYESQIIKTQEELRKTEETFSNLEESLEKQLASLKLQKKTLKFENKSLKDSLSTQSLQHESELITLSSVNQGLSLQLSEISKAHNDLLQFSKVQSDESLSKISSLTTDLSKSYEKYLNLEKSFKEKESKLKLLELQRNNFSTEVKEKEEDLKLLRDENFGLIKKIESLEFKNEKGEEDSDLEILMEINHENVRKEEERLKSIIRDREDEVEQLLYKVSVYEKEIESLQNMSVEINAEKEEIESLKNQVNVLKDEGKRLEGIIHEKNQSIGRLNNEKAMIRKKIQDEFNAELYVLKTENIDLIRKNEEFEEKCERLEADNEELSRCLEEENLKSIEASLSESESLRFDLESKDQETRNLKLINENLQKELNQLTSLASNKTIELGRQSQQLESLTKELSETRESTETEFSELKEKLSLLEQELKKKGIRMKFLEIKINKLEKDLTDREVDLKVLREENYSLYRQVEDYRQEFQSFEDEVHEEDKEQDMIIERESIEKIEKLEKILESQLITISSLNSIIAEMKKNHENELKEAENRLRVQIESLNQENINLAIENQKETESLLHQEIMNLKLALNSSETLYDALLLKSQKRKDKILMLKKSLNEIENLQKLEDFNKISEQCMILEYELKAREEKIKIVELERSRLLEELNSNEERLKISKEENVKYITQCEELERKLISKTEGSDSDSIN